MRLVPSLVRVSLFAVLAGVLPAHGGQYISPGGAYTGPRDVAPPAGGRGPSGPGGPMATQPKNSGPSAAVPTPTPSAAAGPGAAGPGMAPIAAVSAAGGPTTPRRGIVLEVDVTTWSIWWEVNKNPFIRLKEAIYTDAVESGSDEFFMGVGRRLDAGGRLRPTEAHVRDVLPALKEVMERTEQRDIISSVLIAMAKAGIDHPDFEILPLMAERLTRGDQEIRETAALALGISQMPAAAEDYLIALVKDGEAGRKLVDRSEVDYRSRSFAAYGLGLVAWANDDLALKYRCFDALEAILEDDRIVSRDVRVAAVNALGMLAPDPHTKYPPERKLLEDCLAALERYYTRRLGAGEQLIQSHVPPAIAKLLGREPDLADAGRLKDLFLAELTGRVSSGRSSRNLARSAALALGVLAGPNDGRTDDPERKYSEALLRTYRTHADKQTGYFSVIALGQIGGIENRNELIKAFRTAKNLEKPWLALALGVYAYHDREAAKAGGRGLMVDELLGQTLQRAILENKNPETVGALAIALGLAGYQDAALDIRELLSKHSHQDELAGYLCIGLALMGDRASKEDIHRIVETSVRRPELLRQAAIALGKLGDKGATEVLQSMLVEGGQNLAKMSAVASALGFIGDRRTLQPLTDMLFDESLTDLTRAFAAVALGGVIDKELLPWNSKIGTNINYRGAVETLMGESSGILDIL